MLDYRESGAISTRAPSVSRGISLGGYYAPRSAAFDNRVKACLAFGGVPDDWAECWEGLQDLTARRSIVRSKSATLEEARKARKAATR